MLEPSLLCWSVWAVECQCRAWDRPGRSLWPLAAGVFAAAAMLTKYTGGTLLPLLAWGCYLRRRWDALTFLVIPILALVAWASICAAYHHRSHLGAQGLAFEMEEWGLRVLTVLRSIGSVTVLGPILAIGLVRTQQAVSTRWRGLGLLSLATLVSVVAASVDVVQAREWCRHELWEPTSLRNAHVFAFTFHGCFTICAAAMLWLIAARRNVDESAAWRRNFLAAWLVGMFVFNTACVPFNAIRHLLLFAVPLIWLTADLAEDALADLRLSGGTLIASVLLATALAAADYDFANSYRETSRSKLAKLVADRAAAGKHVWFTGNWGFVYYANLAGAYPWVIDPPKYGMPAIQPGDALVHPNILTWNNPEKALPHTLARATVQHWQPVAQGGYTPAALLGQFLRTISPGVNYYSVMRHTLPWEVVVRKAEPEEQKAGMWFYVPPLDDVLVYDLVPADPSR
jgi:hypothetical protein